jgi:hypothetical protein
MRMLFPLSLSLLTVVLAHADSYLFPLQQKVAACKVIARVSLTEATTTKANGLGEIAVCKAKVIEILKGAPDKEITFRFHAYGDFSSEKLPRMVKKEYIVFLHELSPPYRATNEFWVFEGQAGVRPIAAEYQEYQISADGKVSTETFSHSNFIAAIRAFAAQPDAKKK